MKVIPDSFPDDQTSSLIYVTKVTPAETNTKLTPCGCPVRSPCPKTPRTIPFPPTEEHRLDLDNWIKERYISSTFNTCKHQSLQTMSGEPLKI